MSIDMLQHQFSEVLAEVPASSKITKVSLFGSFARGEETLSSDIDFLYETSDALSLFQLGDIQYRLEKKFGRKVDFISRKSLRARLLPVIEKDLKVIYVRQ